MKTLNLLLFIALVFAAVSAEAQTKKAASEIKFGFLEQFEKTGGGYQIKIDYAEMFDGDAAEREAKKDGEPSPGETSGIYIRNKNPKIHTEKVTVNASIIVLKNMKPLKLTAANFDLLRGGKLKDADNFWGFPQYGTGGEPMPCHVTVKNGTVVKIEQVYFP